jgi:hypothetical protein
MNAPAALKPDRYATNIARAKAMHEASGNLLAALTKSGGKYSTSAIQAEIALCDAAIQLWDDGDALTARDNLKSELPEEPSGRRFEFDASARHPDHPGGW